MSATLLPQRYPCVQAFMAAHGVTHPPHEAWRLTDRAFGEIVGIPGSRGILTATNGILCYIEQERSGCVDLFLGHMEWFRADSGRSVDSLAAGRSSGRGSKRAQALTEYE